MVGGHVDAGDTILETIKKEIKEETNWEFKEIVEIFGKTEWNMSVESQKEGDNPNKIIVQVIVKVKNCENPFLEKEKAVEFRWVGINDSLEFFKQNRQMGGFYIHEIVEKYFRR